MPISDAANINSTGVLLSTSGLTQLDLSSDQTSVSIGPGNRWANVYKYLEPFSLSVVGGRMGVVGVPGLLLGGGISFFGNQYGWASDNVVKFEASIHHPFSTPFVANANSRSVSWRVGTLLKLPVRTSIQISSGL